MDTGSGELRGILLRSGALLPFKWYCLKERLHMTITNWPFSNFEILIIDIYAVLSTRREKNYLKLAKETFWALNFRNNQPEIKSIVF